MSEPEVAPGRLRVPGSCLCPALLVLGGRVAELGVVEVGAREVGVLAGWRRGVAVELLVDEIEHERRVDDPDSGGEIRSAVVHERVAAIASAVADLAGDAEFERPRLRPRGERVELAVEPIGRTAEDRRDLPLSRLGQVASGVLDLLGAVEQRAVVDPHGVGVLVFDDGAVDERAEVPERFVVQIACS